MSYNVVLRGAATILDGRLLVFKYAQNQFADRFRTIDGAVCDWLQRLKNSMPLIIKTRDVYGYNYFLTTEQEVEIEKLFTGRFRIDIEIENGNFDQFIIHVNNDHSDYSVDIYSGYENLERRHLPLFNHLPNKRIDIGYILSYFGSYKTIDNIVMTLTRSEFMKLDIWYNVIIVSIIGELIFGGTYEE